MEVLKKYDLRSGQSKQLLCFLDKEAINLREIDRTKKSHLKRQSWLLRIQQSSLWIKVIQREREGDKKLQVTKEGGALEVDHWEQGWGPSWWAGELEHLVLLVPRGRAGGMTEDVCQVAGTICLQVLDSIVGNRKSQKNFPHRNHEVKILGAVNFLLQF